MFRDYYAILEVCPQSSPQEIRAAYRRLSLLWHPDKNQGKDVTGKMQDINEAYSILKDPEKKERYDAEYALYKEFENLRHSRCNEAGEDSQNKEDFAKSYTVRDERVREDIRRARKYAVDLVTEFMREWKSALKDAGRGAKDGCKAVVLLFVVVNLFWLIVYLITNVK